MTDEKLKEAQGLAKKIEDLKSHVKFVKADYENPYEDTGADIYVEPNNSRYDKRRLLKEFLPFTIPEFVDMYIHRAEKEIKKLEKEFEKL